MANVSVYNMDGQNVGTMDLNDAVFAAPVKETEGHGPCETGLDPRSAVETWRRRIRTDTEGLFLQDE